MRVGTSARSVEKKKQGQLGANAQEAVRGKERHKKGVKRSLCPSNGTSYPTHHSFLSLVAAVGRDAFAPSSFPLRTRSDGGECTKYACGETCDE